jgi:hypothetical protein
MVNIDGFLFQDEETAKIALREKDGIRFIKERSNLNDPKAVFALYKKLLEQELFVTPVGNRFLMELQSILLKSGMIGATEIPPIPVKPPEVVRVEVPIATAPKATKTSVTIGKKDYKRAFHVALFFAIVMAISVIGMFALTAVSGNNTNIINYREQILNEYSTWESQLKTEEERLEEWESLLEERENQLREEMNGGE